MGAAVREFDGYSLGYHILFSFEEVICGTLEVVQPDDYKLITSGATGNYDWFFRMFRLQEGQLKAGKWAFREAYC